MLALIVTINLLDWSQSMYKEFMTNKSMIAHWVISNSVSYPKKKVATLNIEICKCTKTCAWGEIYLERIVKQLTDETFTASDSFFNDLIDLSCSLNSTEKFNTWQGEYMRIRYYKNYRYCYLRLYTSEDIYSRNKWSFSSDLIISDISSL